MSFETEFQELETILARLEGGELTLESSLEEYERGVRALRSCRTILAQAERRLEELSGSEAQPVLQPFVPEDGPAEGAS